MAYNPFTLDGKTILITGASSGIGRATAIECSKMGASLIISGRNSDRLRETLEMLEGSEHVAIPSNLIEEDGIADLVNSSPKLDGVVLCAGIVEMSPIQFVSPKKIKNIFETNFFSTIELTRNLVKKKKLNKESSIVAIASVGGVKSITMASSMYGSSKSALNTWMKYAALELANKGIRVNCVCPGMTQTPFIASDGPLTQEDMDKDRASYPLQRYGNPEEIAWSIIYLLSDASKWVTGTNLVIDGGISI